MSDLSSQPRNKNHYKVMVEVAGCTETIRYDVNSPASIGEVVASIKLLHSQWSLIEVIITRRENIE